VQLSIAPHQRQGTLDLIAAADFGQPDRIQPEVVEKSDLLRAPFVERIDPDDDPAGAGGAMRKKQRDVVPCFALAGGGDGVFEIECDRVGREIIDADEMGEVEGLTLLHI